METLTIPKKLANRGELVIIPRKQYETLLGIADKKSLDASLGKALLDYEKGRYLGPFQSIREGKRALRSLRNKR